MSKAKQLVPGSLAELATLIGSLPGFPEITSALHTGKSAAINGAWGSSCALSVSALSTCSPQHTLLIVVPTIRDAEEFADELSDLATRAVRLFPAWESLPTEHDVTDSTFAARMTTVRHLSESTEPLILVTCLPALLQPVPSRKRIAEATRTLRVGKELDLNEFTDWLIDRSFERVTAVELPGEFSIHGGILDIFPPAESDPFRIELFGDEVESIRSFDVESQRRLTELQSIALTATRPIQPPGETEGDKQQPARSGVADAVTSPLQDGESLIDSLPPQTIVVLSDMQQAISEGKLCGCHHGQAG